MSQYAELIKKVKQVDRIAALRLARVVPLEGTRGKLSLWDVDNLDWCFSWSGSMYGYEYWQNVHNNLQ